MKTENEFVYYQEYVEQLERKSVPTVEGNDSLHREDLADIHSYYSFTQSMDENKQDIDVIGKDNNENMVVPVHRKNVDSNDKDDIIDCLKFIDSNPSIVNTSEIDELSSLKNDKECLIEMLKLESDASDDDILNVLDGMDCLMKEDQSIYDVLDKASPYMYCIKVIKNNKLCYMDTAEGGYLMHRFNGYYWEYLTDDGLRQLVYDSLPYNMKSITKGVEVFIGNIANYVKRELRKAYNDGHKRFTSQDYKDIENHIVFLNGVYDVKKNKLRSHTHKKPYISMVNCEYYPYDKATPIYFKLKKDATGADVESMNMFDLMQAYLLMPNRSGKCFFVMAEARDSGKTSFGEFVEGYFPPEQVKRFDAEHLGGRFSYAGFENATLVSCLEMPMSNLSISAAKALKNFTGETKIEVEAKYQNHITSKINFKVLLATNGGLYLPIGEQDNAFYRRVIVIPFVHSVPLGELDSKLKTKLEQERAYIISKCVRKMHKFLKGKSTIVFPESELSRELKSKWTGESIYTEKFVKSNIKYTADDEDAIPIDNIKRVYDKLFFASFSENIVNTPIHCNKKQLVQVITSIYPKVYKSRRHRKLIGEDEVKNVYCLTGIKWATDIMLYFEEEDVNEKEED